MVSTPRKKGLSRKFIGNTALGIGIFLVIFPILMIKIIHEPIILLMVLYLIITGIILIIGGRNFKKTKENGKMLVIIGSIMSLLTLTFILSSFLLIQTIMFKENRVEVKEEKKRE